MIGLAQARYGAYPTLGLGAETVRDRLLPGEELAQGQALRTSNGGELVLQTDGNLVLYAPDGHAIWATDTQGKPVTRAVFQKDGNLVMRSPKGYGGFPEGQGWWDSGTANRGVTQLVLQTDGNFVWYKGAAAAANAVSNTGTHNWAKAPNWQKDKPNFFKKALKVITAPVRAVEDVASKAEHLVEKIPVIGDVTHVLAEAATAPLRIAENIASGARLDHVALGALKDQLKIAKDVAPYAQTVVSFVPGVGTGVAAAIGMGAALAEGRNITDAAKSAIRGAIPGGALAQAGFDMALKVAGGENVGQAALESARGALPPSAQSAFDIGLAVVTGEKIQTALAKGLANLAPEAMQSVLAVGQKAIDSTPGLATALKSVQGAAASKGFQLAAGLIGQKGIGEKALTAVRDQLPADVRQGFDVALNTQAPHVAWVKNVTSAPAPAAPATSSIATAIKAAPVPKAPLVVHEPPKKAVAAAAPTPAKPTGPIVHEPTMKVPAAAAARVAGKYGPYPKMTKTGVGVGFTWGAAPKWRWFTVFANGRAMAQRGPMWLSDSDARRESVSLLEATLGRDYIGTVTRWDWDGQAWHQAPSSGLGAPQHPHHPGHGGGGHGGGRRGPPRVFRGGRGVPGWDAYYPLPAEIVTTTETCRTWSDLVPIPPSMVQAVKQAIGSSGGRPTTMRSDDGTLYLFTAEDGGIAARRCVSFGVGGWASDAWNNWTAEMKELWYG